MPKLSLADFIDVVSKAGSPKITKVREIKKRDNYSPATDFYRPFRQGVVSLHSRDQPRSALDSIAVSLTDVKKMTNYPELIEGYKKWWGRKDLEWFEPPRGTYSSAGFDVAVNPELGLKINGRRHIIKLYNKADPITKFRIDLVPLLMELTLRPGAQPDDVMALLDVRRGKLYVLSINQAVGKAGLDAELAYISNLWPHL